MAAAGRRPPAVGVDPSISFHQPRAGRRAPLSCPYKARLGAGWPAYRVIQAAALARRAALTLAERGRAGRNV